MARAIHRGRERVRKDRGGAAKGLATGRLEGGVHSHVLEREYLRTAADGAHSHAFRLPDGTIVESAVDGAHVHTFSPGSGRWEQLYGGGHAHDVNVGGVSLATREVSGDHDHDMQVETSALDGVHSHAIVLPDGTTIESLMPGEQAMFDGSSPGRAQPDFEVPDGPTEAAPMNPDLPGYTVAGSATMKFDGARAVLDVRFTSRLGELEKRAVGWSIDVGRELPEEPTSVAEGRTIVDWFDIAGSRAFKALTAGVQARLMDDGVAGEAVHDGERGEDDMLAFEVDDLDVELGVQEDDVREFFVVGERICGRLAFHRSDDGWTAKLSRGGLPSVLKGEGTSRRCSVPKSLADVVPERLRWWQKETAAEAEAALGFLVDSGFFSDSNVVLCDGRLTKAVEETSLFRYEPDDDPAAAAFAELASIVPAGVKVTSPFSEDDWKVALDKGLADGAVVVMDPPDVEEFPPHRLVKAVERRGGSWLLAHEDTPTARAEFSNVGRAFKLRHPHVHDRLFVASFPVRGDVLWVDKATWTVGAARDLPIGDDGTWDGAAAKARVFSWASDSDGNVVASKAKKAFLAYDSSEPTLRGSYKLPFADVVEGSLRAMPAGLRAAASRLPQTDVPQAVKDKARSVLDAYADKLEKLDQDEEKRCGRRKKEVDALLSKARLIRKAEDEEERFVYGVVLEPDGVDAQNDTISAGEIRAAAHKFMEDFQNIGLQHMRFVNGKVKILESFIVPEDVRIGGELVKAGTWVFGVRVLCNEIWKAVKDGLLTGFSIGGSAVREPA